jgi:EAL domain-containing protein (putative c-di-GMP-specific phosphodiesterase class I)
MTEPKGAKPVTSGVQDPSGLLDKMDRELAGWQDPVARLRRALERDELVLYAQPIVALRGPLQYPFAEVLVRLREEERALLPPGEFLPAFEHFGMMSQLDRWVVRHAAARLARGARVPRLSVNVSGQSLADAEFVPYVAAELARAKLAPDSIIFEIDESDTLALPEVAARFAAALKARGGKVLVDGFGGRSVSFTPLTALRADFAKVDGIIVRKLCSSDVARSKLGAIVRVGEVIGAAIIGECVENQETLDALKAAGAGYAQGFGLRRPAPIEEVTTGAG